MPWPTPAALSGSSAAAPPNGRSIPHASASWVSLPEGSSPPSPPWNSGKADAADPIEREGSRPAFQGLIYPGTSNLFSPSPKSPPLFIACGYHDRDDIASGMADLYLKYKKAGIPAELHIYSNAGHGFGFRPEKTNSSGKWAVRFIEWLDDSGFLKKS
jgi:acetyl esterase/lipase